MEYIGLPEQDLNCEYNHKRYFTTDNKGNLIQFRDPSEDGYLSCCYCKFERKKRSELEIEIVTACKRIESNVTKVPVDYEFIVVKCLTSKNDDAYYKFVDIFGFVPLKPSANKSNVKDPRTKKSVNVVVLGIDALSHMNFQRQFESSYHYLVNNLSAFGMLGYNKNDDNTYPNILPVLSGLSASELQKTSWYANQVFDDAPLIWKNFSQEGYRTAFTEDAIHVGLFLHEKRGFLDPPTDYYHLPLLRAMDTQIGHTSNGGVANMCLGSRLSFEVLLDLMRKMATTMNKSKRYFHFIWSTALTHDQLNYGQFGDHLLLETLQWFNTEGYLNDTVLILMSDHGIRSGDILSTLQGKIEERMPFVYFMIPQWFQETYPYAIQNLQGNKQRLTTHFDLHETLMDLLHLNNIENYYLWKRQSQLADSRKVPRGISLFLQIPLTRTCEDAGLSHHWCVCRKLKPVFLEGNEIVVEGARQAVETLNTMLSNSLKCQKLVLDSVLNAQVYPITDDIFLDHSEILQVIEDPRLETQPVTYNIAFKVQPSGGEFEATVTHQTNGSWEVYKEISRTNMYGRQSHCIQDSILKKYCYCR
ncbi:unnamed protein product [Allacma fusca]|uniref:Uncharacterized protein n=1 Tax=Allacma fusca TaxID=39272 RepID=A0A8J2JPY9_9HEXA|nr:unnamed protein product [Allacma fusca]